jgi:hypothetical protein
VERGGFLKIIRFGGAIILSSLLGFCPLHTTSHPLLSSCVLCTTHTMRAAALALARACPFAHTRRGLRRPASTSTCSVASVTPTGLQHHDRRCQNRYASTTSTPHALQRLAAHAGSGGDGDGDNEVRALYKPNATAPQERETRLVSINLEHHEM